MCIPLAPALTEGQLLKCSEINLCWHLRAREEGCVGGLSPSLFVGLIIEAFHCPVNCPGTQKQTPQPGTIEQEFLWLRFGIAVNCNEYEWEWARQSWDIVTYINIYVYKWYIVVWIYYPNSSHLGLAAFYYAIHFHPLYFKFISIWETFPTSLPTLLLIPFLHLVLHSIKYDY